MGKNSKSNKNYPLEFPPRDNRAENTPATDEVIEYEAMGVNSRHHSGGNHHRSGYKEVRQKPSTLAHKGLTVNFIS